MIADLWYYSTLFNLIQQTMETFETITAVVIFIKRDSEGNVVKKLSIFLFKYLYYQFCLLKNENK